jgi:hypothetical protein
MDGDGAQLMGSAIVGAEDHGLIVAEGARLAGPRTDIALAFLGLFPNMP